MRVVIDANVLCSGLIDKGNTSKLLLSGELEAIAPALIFLEVDRHKNELRERSKLPNDEFDELLALYKAAITTIPAEEFTESVEKANDLLSGHTKDTEYVVLALHFNCPLWSKEKRLKALPQLEVLDANEVAKKLSMKIT